MAPHEAQVVAVVAEVVAVPIYDHTGELPLMMGTAVDQAKP